MREKATHPFHGRRDGTDHSASGEFMPILIEMVNLSGVEEHVDLAGVIRPKRPQFPMTYGLRGAVSNKVVPLLNVGSGFVQWSISFRRVGARSRCVVS